MKTIHLVLVIILAFITACEEKKDLSGEINTNEIEEIQQDSSQADTNLLIEELQGSWREPEYPFRRAEFKDSTVKFTEEGVIEPPTFKPYKISNECPFLSNSPANDETYFVNPENEICEKISVRDDTLTFKGVESDYTIVYERME